MKTSLRLVVLLVAVFGFTTTSQAAPITYTFSGTASGQLGSSTFTNALVVFTSTADTTNVVAQNVDLDGDGIIDVTYYANPSGLTSVNIAGLGFVTVFNPTAIYAFPPIPPAYIDPGEELFLNPLTLLGTLDSPPALDSFTGLAAVSGTPLLGYNLATSFGPFTGTGGVGYPQGLFVNTSGGNLSFNSQFVTQPTTFTASVPEPTSLSFLGSGILSLVGLARLRRRA